MNFLVSILKPLLSNIANLTAAIEASADAGLVKSNKTTPLGKLAMDKEDVEEVLKDLKEKHQDLDQLMNESKLVLEQRYPTLRITLNSGGNNPLHNKEDGVQVKLTGQGRDIGTLDKLMSLLANFKGRITAMDLSNVTEITGAVPMP